MSLRFILLIVLSALVAAPASAYPPAPFHRIFGTVRDEQGTPLGAEVGFVVLNGTGNVEIVRGPTDPAIGPNINYSVNVPMDSGTTALLYQITALRPLLPFTIRVVIGGVSYVPLQAIGGSFNIGDPAGQTRIDLTIGVDSDNDGLPDGWEYNVIDSDFSGTLSSLADIRPGDDLDGDGLTNLEEYIAGTYALDQQDGLALEIVEAKNGVARLRFLAIIGRTYRLTSANELSQPYAEQAFALSATGFTIVSHLATEVQFRDVFVNIGSDSKRFFKLHVQ